MTNPGMGDGNPTVLVVEDEWKLADYYAERLADAYTVEVAYSCETARQHLDDAIDVALLDRRLPDGHGDDLVATIRERDLTCRVAMVTAVNPGLDIIDLGFDAYLRKPVSHAELHATVERLLSQATYGELLDVFYTVAAKKALLETNLSADERAGSHRYAALVDRFETLKDELATAFTTFSDHQVAAEIARCEELANAER